MFGHKARKLRQLEAVFEEDGEYLEAARVIADRVRTLPDDDPEQYDQLIEMAFGDVAKREALRLEAEKHALAVSTTTVKQTERAADTGYDSVAALKFRRAAAIGRCIGGSYISLMSGIFGVIEGFSLSTPHQEVSVGRLAIYGVTSVASGYMSHRGLKMVGPLTEQILELEEPPNKVISSQTATALPES